MANTLGFSLWNTLALPGFFKAFESEYNMLHKHVPQTDAYTHLHTFRTETTKTNQKGIPISLLLPFSGAISWGQEHYGIELPDKMIYRLDNAMHRR